MRWRGDRRIATTGTFDFPAFKQAFTDLDVPRWIAFYADDAEWLEYRHSYPPRSPRRMTGRSEILVFLERVRAHGVELTIEDEVIGPDRAAFCLWCRLPDGRRIIEHVLIHYREGTITRQVDVEAWDPEPTDDAGTRRDVDARRKRGANETQ